MSAPVVPLFRRSLAFIDEWISELKPKPVAKAPAAKTDAPAAAAGKDKGGKKAAAPAAPAAEGSSLSKVAIKVGKVVDVKKHPESDKLYIEQIDLGEETPRTILSGLQEHIKEEEFLGRMVVVAANLEPRKIAGIPSNGMVLCASTEGKGTVKLLEVPPGVPCGERVIFAGHEGEPEPVLKKKLAKHWETVAPDFKTDANGVAVWQGIPFMTSKGPCNCASLPNGTIS